MKTVIRILKIALAFSLLFWIFKSNNITLSIFTNKSIDWKFIGLALLIPSIINPIIATNRWKSFLKESNIEEPFFTLLKIQLKSQFLGLALPSTQGQDAVRMLMIGKKHAEKAGAAASTVIIERIWGFSLYLLFALFSTLFAPNIPNKNTILIIILTVAIILFFVVLLLLQKNLIETLFKLFPQKSWLLKIKSFLVQISSSIRSFPIKKVFWKTSALIFLFQFLTIVCVALIFKSLGSKIPFEYHLVFYPIIAIISIVPITFGGFGIREGFFAYFYALIGVNKEISLFASLLVYFLLILSPAILGGIIYILEHLITKDE